MLACTAGTAFGACVRANISAKDDVFIAGMGPVGLTVPITAQGHGARVSVADVNSDRPKLAESLGIQHALPVTDDVLDRLLELTNGDGPNVTIDCSGNDAARGLCLQAVGTWGRTVFIGYGGRSLQFEPGAIVLRMQLTLIGSSVCSIGQMEDAATFLPNELFTRARSCRASSHCVRLDGYFATLLREHRENTYSIPHTIFLRRTPAALI